MEYSNFCSDLKTEVERIMGPNYNVRFESVLKNNQVSYDALIIMKKGENMAPTVCLDGYYEEYVKGRNVTDIALDIIIWHERYKDELVIDFDLLSDYESMKENIFVKVINANMNEQLLERLPHIQIYDLALVAYWILEENGERRGSANITRAQMNLWNIGLDDMFNNAIANTKEKYPPKLEHMSDMMKELLAARMKASGYKVGLDEEMDRALANAIQEIDRMSEQKVYVLTNTRKLDGAVYIAMDDVLEHIANQLNSDYYILPSSVHELLLLPADECLDYEYLRDMVVSVNTNHVEQEEVLSDMVYYYKRNTGIIC